MRRLPVVRAVRGKLKLSVSRHMALNVLKGETNCCNEFGHALCYVLRDSHLASEFLFYFPSVPRLECQRF